eukprot:GILJ01002489.1.p1 GENE.GILJ01002489.1~~GILJ01002489.1.p1  ORF type:complete len:250 (+),score=52.28 GILJ01002489.1:50-799(+)
MGRRRLTSGSAALAIQRLYRGHMARKEYHTRLIEQMEKEEEERLRKERMIVNESLSLFDQLRVHEEKKKTQILERASTRTFAWDDGRDIVAQDLATPSPEPQELTEGPLFIDQGKLLFKTQKPSSFHRQNSAQIQIEQLVEKYEEQLRNKDRQIDELKEEIEELKEEQDIVVEGYQHEIRILKQQLEEQKRYFEIELKKRSDMYSPLLSPITPKTQLMINHSTGGISIAAASQPLSPNSLWRGTQASAR